MRIRRPLQGSACWAIILAAAGSAPGRAESGGPFPQIAVGPFPTTVTNYVAHLAGPIRRTESLAPGDVLLLVARPVK